MGLMAGLTVAVMVAIALTLLPALLGFAGRKIDALRVPGLQAAPLSPAESMWHRWGRQVPRTPGATWWAACWPSACLPHRSSACGWA